MNNNGQLFFVDHGSDLQKSIADFICQQFHQQLPDLSTLNIFVPAPDLIYTFRRRLLLALAEQQHTAFIGAEITPLKKWIETHLALPELAENTNFINNHCRQLIILQALQDYPAHFKDENLWQVSASLLHLFDELSAQHLDISSLNEDQWLKQLQEFYGIETQVEHLSSEAKLIYSLWQAWQIQLNDDALIDQVSAYKLRIKQLETSNLKPQQFIIAGAEKLTAEEILFIKQLSQQHEVYFFIQANPDDINNPQHPDCFLSSLIKSLDFDINHCDANQPLKSLARFAFNHQQKLQQRVTQANEQRAQLDNQLSLFTAYSEEQEALAVDLQVRQWLIAGKRNIAIVTENRKLARRVRALLERAGVNLVDSVGWSLSTTTAASVVERWLQCIEQDFAALCFLDFLKSPYLQNKPDSLSVETTDEETLTSDNNNTYLNTVFRFEKDIILHENITANLDRYLDTLQRRQQRLDHWESQCYEQIEQLLQTLKIIAEPLKALYQNNQKQAASNYLNVLSSSLEALHLNTSLPSDEAGLLVLEEITHMQNACLTADPEMNWFDFRTWLASSLENHHYSPSSKASHVRLLNLKQSNSGYYDGLIVASCNASQLPGAAPKTAFFNQSVRHSLGLPDWHDNKAEQYYLFRRLIESADQVLISYCKENNNEEQPISAWLQTFIDVYQSSECFSLLDTPLNDLLKSNKTAVLDATEISLPDVSQAAIPSISVEQRPKIFSSSRHQRLINCPYQFFGSDVLNLRAADELILELQKSEYGQKVHKILEIFHLDNANKPLKPDTALVDLTAISERIFKQDIEDNFLHRGWLKRWLDHCEDYIKWQCKRQQSWQFKAAEVKQDKQLSDTITIDGRLDRIDQSSGALAIVDYKTSGKTPSQADVLNGEDVQLSNYALLLDKVERVEYLKLDAANGRVSTGAYLDGENIDEITAATQQRFSAVIEQIDAASPLISNGHNDNCQFCNLSGLCRQQYWKLNT